MLRADSAKLWTCGAPVTANRAPRAHIMIGVRVRFRLPPVHHAARIQTRMGLRQYVADLWHGRMPLPRAFWEFAILYGTLINAITTLASLAALASGASGVAALALHLLPLPYNVLAVVAIWRSAAHYHGPAFWAQLARVCAVVWAVIVTVL